MKFTLVQFAVALTLSLASQLASAACVCRCVGGEVKALCQSSIDLPPICAPQVCPIVPPAVAPIPAPRVPPIGTSSCKEVQVLNPVTNRYEWRSVCK